MTARRTARRRSLSAAVVLSALALPGATLEAIAQDERVLLSRRVLAQALDWEREIAAALRNGDRPGLRRISGRIERALSARATPTRCDAALQMMSMLSREAGNGGRIDRGTSAEDTFPVRTIATSFGHCEDEAGVSRSVRVLTADFIKPY